ncbi:hypothetical protein ES707_09392 [subsurface metagenome]
MVINSASGLISWVPTSVQTGLNWVVIVSVSDGVLSDFQGFNILVSEPSVPPVNQRPVISSYPITTAIVGETYTYTIYAFDPDDDILTYSIIGVKPIGMTINSANGFIWWTPTSSQIGDNLITVMASDGVLSDTQSFIVKVSEPESEPELTKIEVEPKEMELIVGEFGTFEVTAHYDNATTNIVTFKCIYGSSDHLIAYVAHGIDKVITLDVGTATIFISYTQHNFFTGEEITKTDTIVVTVTPIPMEIIVDDLLTFNEGEGFVDGGTVGEFTVSLVANSDKDKPVLGYFTLPPGTTLEYYEVGTGPWITEPGWYSADPNIEGPTTEWKEWVFGPPGTGFPLEDITFDFRAKFEVAGTYPTLVEVWEVTPGTPAIQVELLVSKDITFVVE